MSIDTNINHPSNSSESQRTPIDVVASAESTIATALALPVEEECRILAANIPAIESLLSSKTDLGLKACAELVKCGDAEQRRDITGVAVRHLDFIMAGLQRDARNAAHALAILYFCIDKNVGLLEISTHVFDAIKHAREGNFNVGLLSTLFNSDGRAEVYGALRAFLQSHYAIDDISLVNAWLASHDDDPGLGVSNNLARFIELEKLQPGSTSLLVDKFQLRDFGRYPIPLLIKQCQECDNVQQRYGVVAYPYFDKNGACALDKSLLQSTLDQLSESGCLVRAIEYSTAADLVHQLVAMHRKYGCVSAAKSNIPLNPIQFLFLAGHGDRYSIRAGIGFEKNIGSADIRRRGMVPLSSMLHPDAMVILHSCDTGIEGGIGQEMSYFRDVYAPIRPVGVESIEVVNSNPLRFNVVYKDSAGRFIPRRRGVK